MALATLTNAGRAGIALAIVAQPLHLAWGTGSPGWDGASGTRANGTPGATLPSLVTATALTNEVGRRTPNRIGYVEPDEAGDVIVPVSVGAEGAVQEARYRVVPGPTPYIYVQIHYNYADASNVVIREMGLFMGTEFVPDLPPGQRYFTPAEIANPGLLLAAQIILPPINRSPSVRQTVEFVLPI